MTCKKLGENYQTEKNRRFAEQYGGMDKTARRRGAFAGKKVSHSVKTVNGKRIGG